MSRIAIYGALVFFLSIMAAVAILGWCVGTLLGS